MDITVDSELVDRVILVHTELVTRKQWTSSLNRGEQCRNGVSFVQAMALCYLYISFYCPFKFLVLVIAYTFLLVRVGKELYFCLHNLVQNYMTCVTEIAQRQKSMQESGRRDGHERHGGRGMSKQDSFTSDGGVNV